MRSFILDTGMLLGLTRGQQWAKAAFDLLELHDPETTVFTSVICHGEMLALAEKRGWGPSRRRERARHRFAAPCDLPMIKATGAAAAPRLLSAAARTSGSAARR